MKYLLIIIIPIFLFSFQNQEVTTIANSQMVNSDSCRISKIYSDHKIQTIYHYNKMKKVTRVDYYEYNRKRRESKINYSADYKYDKLNRIYEVIFYRLINLGRDEEKVSLILSLIHI